MTITPENKTPDRAYDTAGAMVLGNQQVPKTYTATPNKSRPLDNALWLCRLMSVDPLLRDLSPVLTKRMGELLALQDAGGVQP